MPALTYPPSFKSLPLEDQRTYRSASFLAFAERAARAKVPQDDLRPPPPPTSALQPRDLTELQHQAVVVSLLRQVNLLFASVPNGHVRSKMQSIQAYQEGVSAGIPDLLIFTRPPVRPSAPGVALEMKREGATHHAVRPEQRVWHDNLRAAGWYVIVAYGSVDAVAKLKTLGYLQHVQTPGHYRPPADGNLAAPPQRPPRPAPTLGQRILRGKQTVAASRAKSAQTASDLVQTTRGGTQALREAPGAVSDAP